MKTWPIYVSLVLDPEKGKWKEMKNMSIKYMKNCLEYTGYIIDYQNTNTNISSLEISRLVRNAANFNAIWNVWKEVIYFHSAT